MPEYKATGAYGPDAQERAQERRRNRNNLNQENTMTQENKKYPLTVFGLYTTSGANSRSAIITQENADKACAAIQAAVGGKLAVKATRAETKAQKGDKFPDYFLEAVTPDLLAEERARMAEQSAGKPRGKEISFAQGDDAL